MPRLLEPNCVLRLATFTRGQLCRNRSILCSTVYINYYPIFGGQDLNKNLIPRTRYARAMSTTASKSNEHIMKNGKSLTNVKSLENGALKRKTPEAAQLKADRLIWVDLEMTGLDCVSDRILEIACLVTEGDLQIVAEGPHIIIHESDEVLNTMGEWCKEQHGKSGLTAAVRRSKVSLGEAEQMVLDFVREYTPRGKCPLAGNTIGVDRSFIERHMPQFAKHLHYRVVDVSSVKELCRRWFPEYFKMAPVKKETHRAVDDILESIAEMKFYRSTIFK